MITDEMVEKARHAMIGDGLEAIHKLKLTINEQREMARAAIAAALPLIRGAVVEECAEAVDDAGGAMAPQYVKVIRALPPREAVE